jgi:hypothetical protein
MREIGYPLKNLSILDCGSTIHIFNEIARFINYRPAIHGDFVWAGDHKVAILGYGEVDIEIQGPRGKEIFRLVEVAYCKDFACNLVSLRQLHKRGLWWDNRPGHNCLRKANSAGTIVAELQEKYHQFVIEYIPDDLSQAVFFI